MCCFYSITKYCVAQITSVKIDEKLSLQTLSSIRIEDLRIKKLCVCITMSRDFLSLFSLNTPDDEYSRSVASIQGCWMERGWDGPDTSSTHKPAPRLREIHLPGGHLESSVSQIGRSLNVGVTLYHTRDVN